MNRSSRIAAFTTALVASMGIATQAHAAPIEVLLQEGESARVTKFGFRGRKVICETATRPVNDDQATFNGGPFGGHKTTLLIPGEYVIVSGLIKNNDISCAAANDSIREARKAEEERQRLEAERRAEARNTCNVLARDEDFSGFEASFGSEGRRMVDYIRREKLPAAGYIVFDDRAALHAPTTAKRFRMDVDVSPSSNSVGGSRTIYEIETTGTVTTTAGETIDAMMRAYGTTEVQRNLIDAAWAHLRARTLYSCGPGRVTVPVVQPKHDDNRGGGDDNRGGSDDNRGGGNGGGTRGGGNGGGTRGPR